MPTELLPLQTGGKSGFVDREREISFLRTLFGQVIGGRGRVVLVTGEAGIGKTRLLWKFGQRVKDSGAIFAAGTSYENEAVSPYAPWTDVLGEVMKRASPQVLKKTPQGIAREVGRIIPEMVMRGRELGIKSWLLGPEAPGLITPTTEQERLRLFQSVTEFLKKSSEAQPLVTFFDDVIWADTASLQLLRHVARRISDQRIMVVASYRDVDLPEDHPVSRLVVDLNRERLLSELKLTRFTTDAVGQLISSQLGGKASSRLIQLVHNRTGGNPFFVEEVIMSLVEQNALFRSDENWGLKDVTEVNIPTSVRALIKQRTARLSEESVRILSIASVVGMEFSFEILKKVTGYEEDPLIGHVEAAMKARLIFEKKVGPQVTYVFADEQVREFLYESISIVRNRKYHLRIAQSIEDLYSKDLKSHVNELAFHHLQAGNALKAAEYSDLAGDAAARIYAIPIAIKHYTNAVELLEEAEPGVQLAILTKLGDAVFHMADHQKSVEYLGTAVGLAKQLGDVKMVADLHRRLAYSYWLTAGNREKALEHCREGLKAIETIDDSVEKAALCQQMARVYAMSGEAGPATKLCQQAIEISKKFDAWEVLAHAFQTLSFCLPPREKVAILAYREESLKISTEHNLDDPKCRAYANLGAYYCYLKGDYKKAEDAYLKSNELSMKLGLRIYEAWNEGELSLQVYFPLGKWDECKRRASKILETAPELGELYVANPSLVLAFIQLARGELDEAERLIDMVLPIAERSRESEIGAKCYEAASRLHSEKGNLSRALDMAARADSHASKPSRANLGLAVETKFWMMELQLKRGEIDEAGRTLKELDDLAGQIDETWAASFLFWARGRLESARNNWAVAVEELRTATRTLQETGRKYDAANARVDLASSLSKLGKADEARANLNEAKDIFRLLQSRSSLERASRLEVEIGVEK